MSTALGASPRQPNIAYQPDLESYQNRTKERLATESLSKELPDGFPAALRSPLVWKGSNFGGRQDFVTVLAADDLEEIKEALRHFKALHLPLGKICQDTFPLKALKGKLRKLSAEMHNGRGFFVLRGFPVDDLDRHDSVVAYAGVSAYIGSLRAWQDPTGSILAHITDLSKTQAVGTPAHTNEKQVFHTDNGDIVSLLALGIADEGGASKTASSWHVYNVLAKLRREPAFYLRPILYLNSEQKLLIQYFRRLFTGYGSLRRPCTIPPISEAQAEALDALGFCAAENFLKLDFQKGDIQYINNLSILHARDGYRDEKKKRHLVHLWLRDEEHGWAIPPKLQSGPGRTWDSLHHEAASDEQRFLLEPEVKTE